MFLHYRSLDKLLRPFRRKVQSPIVDVAALLF